MRRGKLCRRVAELPCETSVNRSPSACCKQGHVSVRARSPDSGPVATPHQETCKGLAAARPGREPAPTRRARLPYLGRLTSRPRVRSLRLWRCSFSPTAASSSGTDNGFCTCSANHDHRAALLPVVGCRYEHPINGSVRGHSAFGCKRDRQGLRASRPLGGEAINGTMSLVGPSYRRPMSSRQRLGTQAAAAVAAMEAARLRALELSDDDHFRRTAGQ
jgi:hypothetical protein